MSFCIHIEWLQTSGAHLSKPKNTNKHFKWLETRDNNVKTRFCRKIRAQITKTILFSRVFVLFCFLFFCCWRTRLHFLRFLIFCCLELFKHFFFCYKKFFSNLFDKFTFPFFFEYICCRRGNICYFQFMELPLKFFWKGKYFWKYLNYILKV